MKALLVLLTYSIAILISFAVSISAEGKISAVLYEKGSQRSKKLFTLDVDIETKGPFQREVATYRDPEGKVVVEESALLKGAQVVSSVTQQNQTQQKGEIEYDGKNATFSKTENDKTKKITETVDGDFVVSGSFRHFVESKFPRIAAGETVKFRLGVWDRQETIGFSLFKTGEEGSGEQKVFNVKMKASSIIVAALIDPINFKFNKDGSKILEMTGRTAPKIKKGSSWKDLDVEAVYSY
ncbi:MAG: hypothetical protein C5B49_00055 [Bdellovibrio sp.]|nr:MAG: hypothetical protein C5B49_00055 [Bdellovibrio sp.]